MCRYVSGFLGGHEPSIQTIHPLVPYRSVRNFTGSVVPLAVELSLLIPPLLLLFFLPTMYIVCRVSQLSPFVNQVLHYIHPAVCNGHHEWSLVVLVSHVHCHRLLLHSTVQRLHVAVTYRLVERHVLTVRREEIPQ